MQFVMYVFMVEQKGVQCGELWPTGCAASRQQGHWLSIILIDKPIALCLRTPGLPQSATCPAHTQLPSGLVAVSTKCTRLAGFW